jgi:hypothetical protein
VSPSRNPPLRPLADWDDDRSAPSEVIWWSRLDDRYLAEARRLPARRIQLVVFDHDRRDEVVRRTVVRMIGEPRYGPDPDDIYAWQRTAERWVDTAGPDDGGEPPPT